MTGHIARPLIVATVVTLLVSGNLIAQKVPAPDSDAPNAPAVKITNGLVSAILYMPDAEIGYYRATRFDWSGVIADLQAGGHSYFARWNPKYDPKLHDAISGPVQEFVTGQGADAAKPGEPFIKIGVGVLKKPAEAMRGFPTLEIVDGGKWTTHVNKDSIEFMHEVSDARSGYGYRYSKIVALTPGKNQLTLTQHIESTGANPIDTEMYDHNFFVIDGQPTGPDVEVRVPFKIEASNVRGDAIQIGADRLNYLKPIEQANRMQLKGFSTSPSDFDVRVENRKTGAGVRVTSDRPLSDMVFWTSPKATCPETYIHVHAERGTPMDWKITYDFYSLPGTAK